MTTPKPITWPVAIGSRWRSRTIGGVWTLYGADAATKVVGLSAGQFIWESAATEATAEFVECGEEPSAWDILADRINRSVPIEQALLNIAAGKRPAPTPEEYREWALTLGCPDRAPKPAPLTGEELYVMSGELDESSTVWVAWTHLGPQRRLWDALASALNRRFGVEGEK